MKRQYQAIAGSKTGRIYIALPIILIGAALRPYDLGTESDWIDEVLMIQKAEMNVEHFMSWNGVSLYIVLAHFWMQNLGSSETAIRKSKCLIN